MSIFKPKVYYKSIFDINYEYLKKKNIKVIIFDLDNTIITVDEDYPSDKVVELFKKLNNDFKIFIASNNKKERVRRIGKYMNVHAFYSVVKPTKKIRKLLLKKYDVKMSEVAIIGDQVVTDIFMGNRLKMYTVLVDPLGEKDLKITYFNRWLEKRIIKIIKLKRGEYYEEVL
jgi:HAD superfamily phosphatase (TIGR01668 family)